MGVIDDLNPFSSKGKFSNTFEDLGTDIRGAGRGLGLTNPTPPSPAATPDAETLRQMAAQYRAQSSAPGGQADSLYPAVLEQGPANEARAIARANINGLMGVANGTTATAADSLYQQGTDEAAARARGIAAANSRSNPGAALRMGLSAGNEAQLAGTAGAGMLKANEQAAARGQVGQFSDAVRNADLQAAQANQKAQFESAAANQKADLEQQQINNQRQLGFAQVANQAAAGPLQAQTANQTATVAQNTANQKGMADVVGGGSSAIGSLITALSDKRAKTNVRPRSLADAFGEKIHGVEYQYKPGEGDGGEHAGVIAQDVEKVAPGIVKPDARGRKMIDVGHMTTANTSALAEIARRLRRLEARAS